MQHTPQSLTCVVAGLNLLLSLQPDVDPVMCARVCVCVCVCVSVCECVRSRVVSKS